MTTTAPPDSTALRGRARLLIAATMAWNCIEAVVALTAGSAAGSGALVSFGLDAVVEMSAAGVALWYLNGAAEQREATAGRLIGLSFGALAAWVGYHAVIDLAAGHRPDTSAIGIVLTTLSVLVMPALASKKRRTGDALSSKALVAESNQTMVCVYLSVAVLLGLGLNAAFGWWWADPTAALVVAAIAAREGRQAWRGELIGAGGCC